MDIKFTEESDLLAFQKKVMKHFVQRGLEAITHVKQNNESDNEDKADNNEDNDEDHDKKIEIFS